MTMFETRRARLAAARPGRLFVLPAPEAALRNADVHHPWRQSSELLYLTGVSEEHSALVLAADGEATLYLPEPDADRARWAGPRVAFDDAAAQSGIDDVRPIGQLGEDLPELLRGSESVGYTLGGPLDELLLAGLERVRKRGEALRSVHDPRSELGELRLVKDATERDALRRAAAVTVAGHLELLRSAQVGDTSLGLQGRLDAVCLGLGADRMAYPTIVAPGARATCLHARADHTALAAGGWVLVDAGAEVGGYACDLTRTWPVDGATAEQVAVYELVRAAQRAAIDAVAPGGTLGDVRAAARRVLAAGLAGVGLPEPLSRWLPHRVSHWIGLDVHDAGLYEVDGVERVLEEGMAFTVEPGLYVDADAGDVPEGLRGLGIRIEDVVLVGAEGAEVLTAGVPTELRALRS